MINWWAALCDLRSCSDFPIYYQVSFLLFLSTGIMTLSSCYLVVLSLFSKLHRVSWSSNHHQHNAPIFHAAATQLSSVLSPCKIAELDLLVDLPDYEPEPAKEYCKLIDEALTSDNFPSLRHVPLFCRIPFDYFPILQSRNLLGTIAYGQTCSIFG